MLTLAIEICPRFPGCCAPWPCGEGSLQGDPWPRGRSTRPPWVRVDWEKSLKKRKTSRKEVKTERDDLITKQEMESALSVMKSQIVEEIRWAIACVRISATCIYVWYQSFLITRRLNLSFFFTSMEVQSLTPLLSELQEGLFRYKWVQCFVHTPTSK